MSADGVFANVKEWDFKLNRRRGKAYHIAEVLAATAWRPPEPLFSVLEKLDLAYRMLCGVLYNFVPTSGHPGGSISSGRHVEALLYHTMDYDIGDPDALDADTIVYGAGHKALGLYAMWALRNELVRIAHPTLLPGEKKQLRLEDLLGFRRNPTQETPLFNKYHAKPLDGHPTPATPFVRVTTGASGVGLGAGFGLAFAALDYYGAPNAPRYHVLDGEGGMTAGRVQEVLAAAATGGLANLVCHVDWNQASIDSNRVCQENGVPGEYVQWNPVELLYLHDFNVIFVPDGHDFKQVLAAQDLAAALDNGQPTGIVYRTVKGWKYGLEGKASHGSGHKFCSEGYATFIEEFAKVFAIPLTCYTGENNPVAVEQAYFNTLLEIRAALEKDGATARVAAAVAAARERRLARHRTPRANAPKLEVIYQETQRLNPENPPPAMLLKPGASVTLRGMLGTALNVLNQETGGAVVGASADLLESTSVSQLAKGLSEGFFHAAQNPAGRLLSLGGICEDGMGAWMSGVAAFGKHLSVSSSYGAFIAALEHVAARLHGIGQQARHDYDGQPYNPFIMVNGHAGVKTGEDGPTHADPQALQLLSENFPRGVLITLTPWEPQEVWPLLLTALRLRPAVLAPFVTRPNEKVPDRPALGFPPPQAAAKGLYRLVAGQPGQRPYHGTLILQGSEIGMAFIEILPELQKEGLNFNAYYVTSAELFDRLSPAEQEQLYPEARATEAMGLTGFTLPTMYRWVQSREGRARTLYPFRKGRYLGSGQAHKVMEQAELHPPGLARAIREYARYFEKRPANAP